MKKFQFIATLAAALLANGAANAAVIGPDDLAGAKVVYISGASALRLSLAAAVQEVCNNDFTVYFSKNTGGTTKDGDNHRAYACTLAANVGNYTAGTKLLVFKRDAGGSAQGVNPVALGTAIKHMKIDAATCVAGSVVSGGSTSVANFVCSTEEDKVSDAGISDVEPVMLNQPVNLAAGQVPVDLSTLSVGPLVQNIFGVAVNKKAYRALQEAQGLISAGAALDESDAKIPSLPSTFVKGALTGGLNGSASSQRGWNLLIPKSVDASVDGKTVNVCRRAAGSGTQAASNIHFANNPCSAGGSSISGASGTVGVRGSAVAVVENSSAGNVETCLGTTVENATSADANPNAYGLAVLGMEVNPLRDAGDRGYRFVKLDGKLPKRTAALTGDYDFVFESTMQWNTNVVPAGSDKAAFLTALRTNTGKPASLLATDVNTQNGVMSPPLSYGTRASLPADQLAFASRVSRTAGNSCTALKLFK